MQTVGVPASSVLLSAAGRHHGARVERLPVFVGGAAVSARRSARRAVGVPPPAAIAGSPPQHLLAVPRRSGGPTSHVRR